MNINAQQLELALRQQFSPFELKVWDESADHAGHSGSDGTGQGTHFRVRIGCAAFNGLSRVGRRERSRSWRPLGGRGFWMRSRL